jgi:hypothetical protein
VEATRLGTLGEGQKSERAGGQARGRGRLGPLKMRGPISEAVIIVVIGFLIGGVAAAIIHFVM